MPSKSRLSLQIPPFWKFSANLINCNLFWASIKCSFSNSSSKIFCFSRSSFFLSNLSFVWIVSNSSSALLRLVLSLLEDDLEDLECFEEDFEEEDFEDFDFELWLRLDFHLRTSRYCSCWKGGILLWTSCYFITDCSINTLVAITWEYWAK